MSDSLFDPFFLLLFILVFTIDCSRCTWDIPIKLQNWPALVSAHKSRFCLSFHLRYTHRPPSVVAVIASDGLKALY